MAYISRAQKGAIVLFYVRKRYAPKFRRVVATVPLRVYHAGRRVRRGMLRLVLVDVCRGRRRWRRRFGQR